MICSETVNVVQGAEPLPTILGCSPAHIFQREIEKEARAGEQATKIFVHKEFTMSNL